MPPKKRQRKAKKGAQRGQPYRSFFQQHSEGGIQGTPNPEGWINVLCPFHSDHQPSLGVNINHGGWKCHAGCGSGSVLDFTELLGIDHSDVPGHQVYDYKDEDGTLLFRVIRRPPWDEKSGKFTQRLPLEDGSCSKKLGKVRRLPYRLPDLLASTGTIYITEGEKDAEVLIAFGLTATTNPGGAGKWVTFEDHLLPYFESRKVVILPDNDDEGRRHAGEVARSLHETVASIKVLELPGLPDKGDASDWLEAGGSRKELERLIKETEEWRFPDALDPKPTDDEPLRSGPIRERDHYYEKFDRNSKEWNPVSNFVLRPIERLVADDGEYLTLDVIMSTRTYERVPFGPDAWSGRASFRRHLRRQDLVWLGADNDLSHLHMIIARKLQNLPDRRATRTIGWAVDEDGTELFVHGKGAISAEGPLEISPIIYLPHGGQGDLEGKLTYEQLNDLKYKELAQIIYQHLPELNDPKTLWPVIGWFFASPFKPRIQQLVNHFPLLNFWGTTGAGKSATAILFWRLFGVSGELFSCTATEFVLLKLLSCTNAVPMILDEYKPGDMELRHKNRLHRYLRRVYGGEVEARGRPDLTLQRFRLTAPVALVGEVPLVEAALQQRSIQVNFNPNNLTEEREKAFQVLENLDQKDLLIKFPGRYIQWGLSEDVARRWAEAKATVTKIIKSRKIKNHRILDSLTTMTLGLNAYKDFGRELVRIEVEPNVELAILNQLEALLPEGRTKGAVPLYMFIESLSVMAETGRLRFGKHFTLDDDNKISYVRMEAAYAEFCRFKKETATEAEVLSLRAYQTQIRESKARGGYIQHVGRLLRLRRKEGNPRRVVGIDLERAERKGLDLGGFRRGAELAEEAAQRAREDVDRQEHLIRATEGQGGLPWPPSTSGPAGGGRNRAAQGSPAH